MLVVTGNGDVGAETRMHASSHTSGPQLRRPTTAGTRTPADTSLYSTTLARDGHLQQHSPEANTSESCGQHSKQVVSDQEVLHTDTSRQRIQYEMPSQYMERSSSTAMRPRSCFKCTAEPSKLPHPSSLATQQSGNVHENAHTLFHTAKSSFEDPGSAAVLAQSNVMGGIPLRHHQAYEVNTRDMGTGCSQLQSSCRRGSTRGDRAFGCKSSSGAKRNQRGHAEPGKVIKPGSNPVVKHEVAGLDLGSYLMQSMCRRSTRR